MAAPGVIEALDYETLLAAIRADFIARAPEHAALLDLESEPLTKLMESAAYIALTLRQRVNNAARAVMLAYATGSDLDQLGALFGVERLLVDAGDATAVPPVPPTYETDQRLRQRIQLSLEGHSTAGPEGAYIFWALTASPDVLDVGIESPNPGEVLVTVLSTEGDGTATPELQDAVFQVINSENIRPLTDNVTVQGATIIPYAVDATLTFYDGPGSSVARQAAEDAASTYVTEHHLLGHDITRSGLFAALHQLGVQNVVIASPAADIPVSSTEAAYCSSITVTAGGVDE
nr:baseplate J/gp47 family protein [Sedimenticola hydrogenitrophicus]